jgi:hypothetical protein
VAVWLCSCALAGNLIVAHLFKSPQIHGALSAFYRLVFSRRGALGSPLFFHPHVSGGGHLLLVSLERRNLSYGPSDWVLALSKGHNRVGVSLRSPEDGRRPSFRNALLIGNRPTFRNAVFIVFRISDDEQSPNPSHLEFYTQSNLLSHVFKIILPFTSRFSKCSLSFRSSPQN